MFIRTVLIVSVFIFAFAAPDIGGGEKPDILSDKPDIILITADTVRADYLSCYGYPQLVTPNIDRKLAKRGALFTHCITPVPLTGPAHASILTSLYPQEHGAIRNGVPIADFVVTLAEILHSNGYRTGAFVSGWTLIRKNVLLDRGFEVYDDQMTDRYGAVNTERTADETYPNAVAWLKSACADKKPVFFWLHFFDPHAPYKHHAQFSKFPQNPGDISYSNPHGADKLKREKQRYKEEIAFVDSYVGLILNALEETGRMSRSLIIFTSDHGESLGEHNYVGHGREVYHTCLRVPLILRFDGVIKEGAQVEKPVSLLDIMPTILDFSDIKPKSQMQGISLAPLTIGGKLPSRETADRTLYFQTYPGTVGHVPKFLRWLFKRKPATVPSKLGLLANPYKIIYTPSEDKLEVYNLARDPYETNIVPSPSQYDDYGEYLVKWVHTTASPDLPSPPEMSAEDEQKLRSLGYIQ